MKLFYKIIFFSGATIFSIFLFIAVSFTLYVTYRMPFNNIHLKIFEDNFRRSIAGLHPGQSSLITEAAEVGNWADGTYCEFLAGQFRSSLLSKEELEKLYPYNFFSAGVYFIDEDIFNHSPWADWKEKYLKNYKAKNNEDVYLVWKSDYNNSPAGDIRCD